MRRNLSTVAGIALVVLAGAQFARADVGVNAYVQTNLVASDASYNPQIVDPHMINAWGIALRPPGAGGHIWISNNRDGTSSEYIGDVPGNPLHQDALRTVTLDTGAFADRGFALITGQVYNAASDLAGQPAEFSVSGPAHDLTTNPPTPLGTTSGSAKFVFVTKDGTINAWRSNSSTAMDSAPVVVDYSKTAAFPSVYAANPVYTGVAMTTIGASSANFGGGNHLFATDFRNGAIEVFDNQWHDISPGVAQDPTQAFHFQTPSTVQDLHPFNVMDLQGHLYVTYAKFDPNSDEGFEDVPGFGHLVEYNEDGTLAKDFNTNGSNDDGIMDSPWGVAIAPSTFGAFANDVLVADFGNEGTIAAFDPNTGDFIDDLRNPDGSVLTIDGVWGLAFGNGVSLGDANSLYFTAGPNVEQDGLFGKVTVVPEPTAAALCVAALIVPMFIRRRGARAV
ncbi:MAG TPA: TIGR03118 family protein [Tepidisphaeraceae bacterium]